MAISARASHALHKILGDEAADDMVNWMHGIETSRSELRDFNELAVQRNEARLDALFAIQDNKLDERFAAYDRKLDERFAAYDRKLDERFARIDERFARIDERFALIDERFALIDERFARIDERFAKVDARFTALEQKIDAFDAKLERRFADLLKWSFMFWIGAVGAVAALAGVLR